MKVRHEIRARVNSWRAGRNPPGSLKNDPVIKIPAPGDERPKPPPQNGPLIIEVLVPSDERPKPPPKNEPNSFAVSPPSSPPTIDLGTASTVLDAPSANALEAPAGKITVTPTPASVDTSGPRIDPLQVAVARPSVARPAITYPKPECTFGDTGSCTGSPSQISSCSSPKCEEALFCDFHWGEHLWHKNKPAGPPHSKIDGELFTRLVQALKPPKVEDLEDIHHANEVAAWFGVERFGGTGTVPVLRDYGRIADLMHAPNLANQERDSRTPSLVSFVGGTGAGKSTVIRTLILLSQALTAYEQAPVIGRAESTVSTSEDVHLYQDPETAKSNSPILFADCEGLGGSEPQAAKLRGSRWQNWNKWRESLVAGETTLGTPPATPEPRRVVLERQIEWDKSKGGENGDGGGLLSRGDFVGDLYPRLLYTFSDVVVYVLGASDHKTTRHAMAQLISWADVAVRTSSNQPVLPSAIVVLNSSDQDISSNLWSVSENTKQVFEDLDSINYKDDADELVRFAKAWLRSDNSPPIATVKDLVLRYYSSVQVIRLPAKGQLNLMLTQATQLRSCISDASKTAQRTRSHSRMLLDVEQLQGYFHDALSHFSRTRKEPFDFVQASFRHSPISADFGGNVLRLALNVTEPTGVVAGSPRSQRLESGFFEVSFAVASSILLNSARHGNVGNAAALFSQYSGHLKKAVEEYRDRYWPCEYESRTRGRCVNLASGHAKGHQNNDGWVISPGHYMCSVDWDALQANVTGCVSRLLTQLVVLQTSETKWRTPTPQEHLSNAQKTAVRIHREKILPNFIKMVERLQAGDKQTAAVCPLRSQKSCLYCLAGMAEYPLPCGHILCRACVEESGEWAPLSRVEMEIKECPMGCYIQKDGQTPWLVHLKPLSTGARVMSLDGGGIRGIAELEVLFRIEEALGGKIPIQSFFDLIVGTSTGGLIALGLTSMNWTVRECIEKFEALCDEAFTRRHFAGGRGILVIVDTIMTCKYKTKPLENALQKAFPKELCLFGDTKRNKARDFSTRVAVTTTLDGSAPRAHVLSNYNYPVMRPEGATATDYHFERPDRRLEEIKIWQAARATAAAPGYFKPFHHKESARTYYDGAFFYNNPVQVANQERELLWPESDRCDVLLSLGTGKVEEQVKRPKFVPITPKQQPIILRGLRRKFNLLNANLAANLDCDLAWENFERLQTPQLREQPESSSCSNFIRLNPVLPDNIPELDEKDKLGEFREQVKNWVMKQAQSERIGQVARKLIASSFYFESNTRIRSGADADTDVKRIKGHILCQMPHRQDVTELGLHLKALLAKPKASLSFVVSSVDDHSGTQTEQAPQPFTLTDIESMIHTTQQPLKAFKKHLSFKAKLGSPMHIYLQFADGSLSKGERHLISGFPRRPRDLRQMAPMQAADLSALADLTTKPDTPTQAPFEHPGVDWSAPDLERYPDPKAAPQPGLSRTLSM